MKKHLSPFIALIAALIIHFNLFAQKLPAIQQVSVKAPAKVKANGLANEWNNKFQAYNNSVDVFYTMANDQENLYLVVQAKDEAIAKKIISGGVLLSLTVQKIISTRR